MLAQSSESFDLLQRIDPDVLGSILILGTIGIFILCIITVVSVSRTWNNIAATRLTQRFMRDLLTQGYSVEDVERLAYGGPSIGRKVRGFVQSAKCQLSKLNQRHRQGNRPMPPVKQNA